MSMVVPHSLPGIAALGYRSNSIFESATAACSYKLSYRSSLLRSGRAALPCHLLVQGIPTRDDDLVARGEVVP